MTLRPATPDDLEAVSTWIATAAECALWSGPRLHFPIDGGALRAALDFDFVKTFALIEGDELVGFGQMISKGVRRGHLARVIVARALRRRGHGESLVRALVEQARAAGHAVASLNVDPSNEPAIALYAKVGFRPAPRPADEPDSIGSHYMELRL